MSNARSLSIRIEPIWRVYGDTCWLSRFRLPGRLVGMSSSLWKWMAAAVLVHLVVSMIHGAAHSGAHIVMSQAATLFVFIVILAGPIVGLALSWRFEALGSLIVALTMAGALIFGVV